MQKDHVTHKEHNYQKVTHLTPRLCRLDAQLRRLTEKLAPVVSQRCLYPRFPAGLFHCDAFTMQDYLTETADNVQRLKRLAMQQTPAGLDWLAQRVADQMAALCREADSWWLRIHDRACQPVSKLYARLIRLQQERQRLLVLHNADHDAQMEQDRLQYDRLKQGRFTEQESAALQHLLDRNQAATQRLLHTLRQRMR